MNNTIMLEWIINYATLIAFLSFLIDNIIQINHIYKRKSSKDISIGGVLMRFAAALILLTKYVSIKDEYLIMGQSLFTITFAIYFILLVKYRK